MKGPLLVSLTSLGCKVNYAEMASLAGELASRGCDVITDGEHADVFVLNSCTVTRKADSTTRQRLHRMRRDNASAHILLTGCSVDGNQRRYSVRHADGRYADSADVVVPNARKGDIADYISALQSQPAPIRIAAAAKLRSRYFLKVQDGCNHRCTYCIVWQARGASISRPVEAVLDEARTAVTAGFQELVLCGVDLGSYGRGSGTTLAALLAQLFVAAGSEVRIRLSSINANDIGDDLVALSAHPQLCPHWHIPLQSGADPVLKAMHRGYRRAHYLRVINDIRATRPETEFTTDIMVGFPGETEDDHSTTLDLVDEAAFLGCHIFRFSARPGTPAAHMQPTPGDIAKRRSLEMHAAAARNAAQRYASAAGRTHDVIWDDTDGPAARGVSATYHTVEVPQAKVMVARRSLVSIDSATESVLRGRLVTHD